MRVIALDIGDRRIGVAISDPLGRVASPLAVLDTRQVLGDGRALTRLIEDYEPELALVGLPLTMEGEEGPQARHIRATVDRLARFLPIPIEFVDERLSSAEAKRRMSEAGGTERTMRGSVDKVAAAILLQGYLDAQTRDDEG